MIKLSKQFIYDFSIIIGTSISNKQGYCDDPIQVKRNLKNKKIRRDTVLIGMFIGAITYIGNSICQLCSSSVNYVDAKIKTQMIVNTAQELKKSGLDYSPEALTKYGIISAKKENCHSDPDDDNRLMKVLQNILNFIHNGFYTKICSAY